MSVCRKLGVSAWHQAMQNLCFLSGWKVAFIPLGECHCTRREVGWTAQVSKAQVSKGTGVTVPAILAWETI